MEYRELSLDVSRAAGKRVPRVHTTRGFRHSANPTGASCLLEGCRGRARVRRRVPRVHAGRGSRQSRPQGTGGCRKATPACTHGTRFPTRARRDAALPQLAGRRDFGATRKFVPRVRMGCSFWHGHERCAPPAGMRRAEGPGPAGCRAPPGPAAAAPSPSPSRGTGRAEVQLVAAEARCERFLQATPIPQSAPPLRLRRWEGQM
jgi:hypothetical protein